MDTKTKELYELAASAVRNRTLELLQNRSVKLTLRQISEDTGLPQGWLSMFGRGKIDDPSYYKLRTLYEYLITRCHG